MRTCNHKICIGVDDDTCHIDTTEPGKAWVVGITREQYLAIVVPTLVVPAPFEAMGGKWGGSADELTDFGMDILECAKRWAVDSKLSKRDRAMCQRMIDRCRERGLPRDGWRSH